MTKCNSQKTESLVELISIVLIFMERPRDLQVREHRNTDAIDIFLALFKALAFHR